MKYLRLAFSLLTIFPVGSISGSPQAGDSGRAAVWYPLVGLVIGCVVSAGWWVFHLVFPDWLAAALSLAVWVLITGGLHLDGLADCCDGLPAAASPERRLEIMADPHIGTFGVVGLILVILLKLFALAALPESTRLFALVFAPTCSRWLVLLAGRQPLARTGGMAADFAAGLTNRAILLAALIPLALLLAGSLPAALSAVLAALAAVGIFAFARSRIGGVTGDVFGLTIELTELVLLLTYATF
ncbi:MAG: adenosylcobinamide-GDP ribazoletransferase [Leptolinea sp.]|jgi:adenosylcobinamide-GDP ribazoletransferase|nr:adenosylcobinamide-GDP ribazoletransferase [Leptolinea sp.]